MTKIQPEMRSQVLVKLSTISYGSTSLPVLPLEMVDNFRSLCKSPLADFFVSGKS